MELEQTVSYVLKDRGLLGQREIAGIAELRNLLLTLLGGPCQHGVLLEQTRIGYTVFRFQFEIAGQTYSLVAKLLETRHARLNQLITERCLPAIDLADCGLPLLGSVALHSGDYVWHVFNDLGNSLLDIDEPNREYILAIAKLVAQIHTDFTDHELLGLCRLYGNTLGGEFYSTSVRDALRVLRGLQMQTGNFSSAQLEIQRRLSEQLHQLLMEEAYRLQALAEIGGPETLLHGDLWPQNAVVNLQNNKLHVRLLDWDRAGVGPVSYDVSAFLSRFPLSERLWILNCFREAAQNSGWTLPSQQELNVLFCTAEYARLANSIIWPALAILEHRAQWAFEDLSRINQWFEAMEPILPSVTEST